MSRRVAAAIIFLFCPGRLALAGGGPATDAYDQISTTAAVDAYGLGDVYLLHNFNDPISGTNQLREFDLHSDQPSLGYLELTLARHPRRIGFRLDVGVGATADVYEQQDPAVTTNPTLARSLSYVEQAFLTVMVPLAREIQLDVGRFSTPVGLEDNESISNWNYSRSLLYSWAEPSLHAGLRLSSRITRSLAASLFWVNGWNSVFVNGSSMRSFAAAASYKPRGGIEVVLVYMGGLEHPPTRLDGPLSFRDLVAAYFLCAPTRYVRLALAVDYGDDRANGGVTWWGIAGYARFQALPWLAAALRGEYLTDTDGFITGTRQRLAEATATLEAQRSSGRVRLIARLEYRHDQSNALVFTSTAPSTRSNQDTLTLALLAAF
jgi:Putative beta-barrel porin-2, OmpL-like. bbp2